MRKYLILILLFNLKLFGQTVNCNFVLNSDLVDQTNQQVFSTLEKSINEFINSNLWNVKSLEIHQRVKFNLVLNLNSYVGSNFNGTLQVQVERPVYESTYLTPIFNFLDKLFFKKSFVLNIFFSSI